MSNPNFLENILGPDDFSSAKAHIQPVYNFFFFFLPCHADALRVRQKIYPMWWGRDAMLWKQVYKEVANDCSRERVWCTHSYDDNVKYWMKFIRVLLSAIQDEEAENCIRALSVTIFFMVFAWEQKIWIFGTPCNSAPTPPDI